MYTCTYFRSLLFRFRTGEMSLSPASVVQSEMSLDAVLEKGHIYTHTHTHTHIHTHTHTNSLITHTHTHTHTRTSPPPTLPPPHSPLLHSRIKNHSQVTSSSLPRDQEGYAHCAMHDHASLSWAEEEETRGRKGRGGRRGGGIGKGGREESEKGHEHKGEVHLGTKCLRV